MTFPDWITSKFVSMRKENKTVREISEETGCNEQAIRGWLSRNKIYKRDNRLDLISQITETEKAYLAGIIDGEGSIIISKLKPNKKKGEINPRYQLFLKVSNTDRRLLEWISKRCLVNIHLHERKKSNQRKCYTIHLPVVVALELLECIYSYIIIKKEQVDLAVRFRKSFENCGHNTIPDNILQEREWCYQEMKRLHKQEF